jgi:beta-RFAP synthase
MSLISLPPERAEARTEPADARAAVTLRAPGRLHLGFLDPAGALGRRFGSLGLVIDGFETEISLRAAERDRIAAGPAAASDEIDRVAAHLQRLRQRSGCHQPLALHLHRTLPPHTGLGSGTQLALAVGRAFAQWHGLPLATSTLAQWLGRGARSGIGIAGFDQGGLLLDGGPGADGSPARLLARLTLPPAWAIVVVQDSAHRGLSGADEKRAIAALAPLPQAAAAEICHQVLMQVLAGAASAEFTPFARGINRVQRILGEHFAPAQGGHACSSPAVGRLIDWVDSQADRDAPLAATGQSSWGPTAFAIVPSREAAAALLAAAQAAGVVDPHLSLRTVAARAEGAVLIDTRHPARGR